MPSCVRARFHVATPRCSACVVLVLPRSSRDCVRAGEADERVVGTSLPAVIHSNITMDLSLSPLPLFPAARQSRSTGHISRHIPCPSPRRLLSSDSYNMCLQTTNRSKKKQPSRWQNQHGGALRVCAPPPHGHCVRARLSLRVRRLPEQISLPRCLAARAGRRGRRGRRPRVAPSALRCEPPAACLPPRRGLCRACGRGWRRW